MLRSSSRVLTVGRALIILILFFCLIYLRAQVVQGAGAIAGTVTDSGGAAISAAKVVLHSPYNSTARNLITSGDGSFTAGNLATGTYIVDITAPGFGTYRNPAVVVAVGRVTHLDARLVPATANQQVTVEAQTSALDTTQSSPVANIDRDRIEELPIPGRNYLNFTLLSPALASANPALAVFSPSESEGGFSAGGLRPSSNALTIDGVDDDDEYTGLSRTELSPEAISDFQIVDHGYAAQSGGSAGGSVDVETRSGGGLQHGDAFVFEQNGVLNSTPPLELDPHKPDENRMRVGLSTGGEVRRSKAFYYLAGEQEIARGEDATDLSPQLAAQIDAAVAHAGPLRGYELKQGFSPTTNEETELSGRLDRNFGANSVMLRYALTNNRSVNNAFNTDDLTDESARGSAFYNDNSLNASWNDTLSPRVLNQVNFEVAQRRVALRTGDTAAPGITVAGIAEFGTPDSGNSRRYETHVDAGENLIDQKGKHLVQAGVALNHIGLRAADQEGFTGLYVFSDLAALSAGEPDFYTQNFGDADTSFGELRISAYLQDHLTAAHGLAIDYGIRYDDNHLPSPFPQHAFNLSPRIGFAWSHQKNWVLRGGFGTFFDRYLLSTVNRIEEFNGTRAQQQVAEGGAAAALYQSGAWYTAPQPEIAPSIFQAPSSMKNPYAETTSFGVERALPSQWTVSAEYRFVHGVHLGRTVNRNLLPPVLLNAANAPTLGVSFPAPQQIGRFVFPQQRLNPAFDAIDQFEPESASRYNGLTLTMNRQFTEEFELMAGYTFSKTIDDASYDTEQPQNPYNLASERAKSLENQSQRFVLSGLWVLGPDLDDPRDRARASAPNLVQRLIYGLELAPIFSANSGFPGNPLTGLDSSEEHIYPFAARPSGLQRNSLSTPAPVHFDLRVLKMVPIWRGHLDIVGESFNLLNRQIVDRINPVFGSGASAASTFAQPIQDADARRVQFSLDFEY